MIDVLKFQEGHFDFFVPIMTDDIHQIGYASMKRGFIESSKVTGNDFRTFVCGDRIVAVCGIMSTSHWSGEVVAMMGIDARHHTIALVRSLNDLMDRHQSLLKIHRLQMTAIDSWPLLKKWAKLLGFEYEGKMKAYGPNREDHLLYGRTRWVV